MCHNQFNMYNWPGYVKYNKKKKMTINIYNIPGLMKFDNPKSVPESSFGDSRRKLFKEAEEIVRLDVDLKNKDDESNKNPSILTPNK